MKQNKLALQIANNTLLTVLVVYILPLILLATIFDIILIALFKFNYVSLIEMKNYIHLAPIVAYAIVFSSLMILKKLYKKGYIFNENTN